jgi:preprotein translocase subunit SecA
MEEGMPIESRMISRRIEGAQKAVESQNFESRKHVLEYDDVMNKQREAVYSLRNQLMQGVEQKQLITDDYLSTILSNLLDENAPEKVNPEQWNTEKLFADIYDLFGVKLEDTIDVSELNRHDLGEAIFTALQSRYDIKEQILGEAQLRYHERVVMLSVLDGLWKEHLLNMDHLKEGIGLRGYAQQDPLVAYKKESFEMFEQMMLAFQEQTARHLFRMQILAPDGSPIETLEEFARLQSRNQTPQAEQQSLPLSPLAQATKYSSPSDQDGSTLFAPGSPAASGPAVPHASPSTTIDKLEREFARSKQRDLAAAQQAGGTAVATQRRVANEVGRNDPCPCGSGKKYKKCHGAAA